MALVAGSVSVNDACVESGTGLALDLYRGMRDGQNAALVALGRKPVPAGPICLAGLRALAQQANQQATKLCAFHESSSLAGVVLDERNPFGVAPAGKALIGLDAADGLPKVSIDGGAPQSLLPSGADGITGPVASTSNGIPLWNGTTGAVLKDSPVTVDPTTGSITLPALATVDGVDVSVLAASVALLGAAAPADVDTAAAAAGVAITAARSDHKHDVTTAAPVAIGSANAEGTAAGLARADHVHDHGALAGGDRHAVAVAGGAAGFLSGADKSKLDGLPTSAVPTSRTITAGAGLTGGGDLSADRTLDVAATDSTIVVDANGIRVGTVPAGQVSGIAAVATSGSASDLGTGTLPIARIADGAVTYGKLQDVSATDRLLGRATTGAGDVEEIACTAAGRALLDDADAPAQRSTLGLGALATKASIATGDIDADAVTFAKLQNVATARVLGRTTSGSGDVEELTGAQATALLDVVTSTTKGLAPASGGGTSNFLRADGTWAAPAGGSTPDWHGNLYAAFNDCDPKLALKLATMSGSVAATPTNVSVSVARIAYFRPPANITVNKIRFFGVGATTQFRIAIYNGATLARLIAAQSVTTAPQAWGSVGSGLGLALTAGQLYFIAVSAVATSTTAGMLCMGPTIADTTGRIGVLPKSWPGGLDLDAGFIDGAFAQFAVTNGVLPDPAATIAAQAAWTGGFPLLFLDNNDA